MLNLENVCRTCALEGDLQSLFIEDSLNPAAMLTEIVDIKVIRGDKYPQNICTNCLEVLKTAYVFKNQCLDAHKKFEHYLKTLDDAPEVFVNCKDEFITFIKEETGSAHLETDHSSEENVQEQFHNDESYVCDQCGVQFKYQKNYKRHLKNHCQISVHTCPICGKRFSRKYGLEQHSQKHSSVKPFACELCDKSYKRKPRLEYHVELKHALAPNDAALKCNVCDKQFLTEKTFNQHKVIHEKNNLCNYCGRNFARSSSLQRHIRTHTGEKPFACTECNNKLFTSRSQLYHHRRIHHSNEKPYKCDFCGKSFALPKWLKSHLLIHTNDKPFTCDICNQSFRQIHHLQRHKFVHTGEKPFQCSICSKQFTQNSNLRTHMRTHTGEKPYVCSICNRGFHDSSSMKNHRKKHSVNNEEVYDVPTNIEKSN